VDDKAKLNPYNHYLVVENGTVNLETGELLDHSPEHYSTICAPVAYNPQAKEPTRFFQFLEEIMQGDKDLIEYVHRVLGYCLTGETRQHEFYILYGPGGNGKGVLLTLIKSILGEYLAEVTEGALAKSISGNTTNPTILQAKDCRIMLTNESEKGTRLNASLIKQISAGEEICPRTLYKANEHFIPHMKLLCATNHLPEIDWNDGGIRRRIRIIPFPVVIPNEKKDTLLDKKLLEEREGVLKWLIEGAVSYYKDGMVKIPEAVQNAMNRERFRTDTISWFFNCAVVPTGEKADRYQAHRVYEAYLQFCTYKGIDLPESETMFGRRFKQLIQDTSINWKKCSDGMYYEGLKLLSDDADNGVAA
jgi:putative DNA primase/helicase